MGLSLDPLQMAQLQKTIVASRLLLVLLSSSYSLTFAGFVSPGNSIYVGSSPTLPYLLACGHIPTKPPYLSTHDIYTLDQVFVFSPAPVIVFTTDNFQLTRWQRDCATYRQDWACHRQGLR